MSIEAIGPISAMTSVTATPRTNRVDFASLLSQGLENLQAMQTKADELSLQAATGRLTDVHDYIIAATEANLATQLTVAVRNKALDAFNEIMRMQA